ncbi:hypothetical protein NC652_028267 [Populus alba x Populus x berolinensis]|nr:hypothetical protein NC652_028267 [Populus alba x Populus x berolinensis]
MLQNLAFLDAWSAAEALLSLDGENLVSGSSDGSIYLNNYTSSELVKKIKAYEQACINVVFHPVLLPAVGMGMLLYLSEHFHDGWFNSSPGNLEQTNKKANLVGNFVPYA